MPNQEEFSLADFEAPSEEFSLEEFQAPTEPRMVIAPGGFFPMPRGAEAPTPAEISRIQAPVVPAGRALETTGKAAVATLADVGEAQIKFPGMPIDAAMRLTEATREPGEPPSNIEALVRGEPLPAITQRRVLPPVLRAPLTASQGIIQTAPQMAAVAGAQAIGIPAYLTAPLVFGMTPEGFDPEQAAIAAALPIIGKWSGTLSENLATKLGISSREAGAIINRLGGTAGAAGLLTADAWNAIRNLPEDQQKDAWFDALGNIAGMAGLGAVAAGRLRLRPEERVVDVERMKPARGVAPTGIVEPAEPIPSERPFAQPPVEPPPTAPAPAPPRPPVVPPALPAPLPPVAPPPAVQAPSPMPPTAPAPPAAPAPTAPLPPAPAAPVTPSLEPGDLEPALLVNGVPVAGGKNHREIFENEEKTPELIEAFADDSKHVFIDSAGNVYTRQQAADALGEKKPLQSERLTELQAAKPPAAPAPVSTGLEGLTNTELDDLAVNGNRAERDLAAKEREQRRKTPVAPPAQLPPALAATEAERRAQYVQMVTDSARKANPNLPEEFWNRPWKALMEKHAQDFPIAAIDASLRLGEGGVRLNIDTPETQAIRDVAELYDSLYDAVRQHTIQGFESYFGEVRVTSDGENLIFYPERESLREGEIKAGNVWHSDRGQSLEVEIRSLNENRTLAEIWDYFRAVNEAAYDEDNKPPEGETPSAPQPPIAPPPELPPAAPEVAASEEATETEAPPVGSIMGPVAEISQMIATGGFLKQQAIRILDAFYGGTMAQGKYSAKDLTDAIEMGINQWIRQSRITPSGRTAEQAIDDIKILKGMLASTPTQTTRTAEMDKMQQFSTPPPHAYVVNWVANIQPYDVVLEPSAGVGGIAVFAKTSGAIVMANELSPRRAELLRQSGIANVVTTHNAEMIDAYVAAYIKDRGGSPPNKVVMNPPFSNAAMTERKNTLVGAKHIEAALRTLPPGGRLVAIVGEGMAMGKPAFVPWWRSISQKYNVRANIGISGKEYAKYGTHFSNQIIVIDNTGPTRDLGAVVTGNVEKVEDLIPLLEGIKNDRVRAQPAPAQPSGVTAPPPTPGTPGAPAPTPTPPRPSLPGPTRPAGGAPGTRRPTPQGPGGLVGVLSAPTVGTGGVGHPTVTPGSVTGTPPTPIPGGGSSPPASRGGEAGLTVEQKAAGEHELIEHGVYSEYKPRKVHIPGAQPSPTPLVETTAMASVEPVDPKYSPSLPRELVTSGALTDVQLEQIVYGGQAHQVILPNSQRMGYFVGDGTGVGKTRIIGGIMLDNTNQGRKKHVWISVKKELLRDITGELRAIGIGPETLIDMNKNNGQNVVGKSEGIAFVTYAGLSRGNPGLEPLPSGVPEGGARKLNPGTGPKPSRMQLLYNWLGPDFDGVIALDECHKAGNAIDLRGSRGVQEASLTGMMALDLQALFPKARILYSSATGASSVTNLSYADRLGIWGEGTPWPNKLSFFSDIQAGGLSAMEIVARDLKSMGRYLARTLSFEGVTKEQLTHDLTPEQIAIYNELSDAWQLVLQNRNETMAQTGAANNGHARGKANSALYGAQQRFYNQLLTALQMPSVLKYVRAQLDAGNSIILSLVNTNEATLNRELAAKGAAEGEPDENWLDDVDLSPKQILLQYIEKSYPTQLYQQETDANGNIRWKPVFQTMPDGSQMPVEDPRAVAKKQELLDRIALLKAPENPIEMILNEFGHENVAEITGRKRRIVNKKQPDGTFKQVLESRSDAKLDQEQRDFEDGKRRILLGSGKAGTGFTFSASRRFKNQQRRFHLLIQMGWRSDEALQAMGRSHRNDQVSAPHYVAVSTNLRGHQRFISTIMRRLAEMGALTGGERKGAGGDLFDDTNNLENDYAEDAVVMLFRDLHHGTIEGMEFSNVTRQLGYTRTVMNEHTGEMEVINTLLDRDGGLNEGKIPTIQQFLNRILAMRFADQNNLFDEFMDRMQQRIERAKEDGSYDPGTQTLKGQNIRKLEDKVVYEHPSSTAKTRLVEIQYDEPVKTTSFDDVNKGKPVQKYVKNIRSGKLYAIKEGPNRTTESGTIVPTYRRIGPGSSDLMARSAIDDFLQGPDAKFELQEFLTFGDAEAAWNAELAKTPKIRTLRDTYVVGAFLPIWDRLEIPDPKIWRITTAAKETFLGAHIPPGMVRDVRIRLGAGSGEAASPEATLNDILARNTRITLANGWELKRSRVQGEPRIEVVGMTYDEGRMFVDKMGGFMERIQYQPRYFVPTDPQLGVDVMTRILKHSPPVGPTEPPGPGGISVGPGGASPGDVPAQPPTAAGVASQPSWQRVNGVVTPSSPGLVHMVRNFGNFILATTRQLAGQWPVKTTMASRETGEAMARYAASNGASLLLAKVFSTQSLAGTGVEPAKFGEMGTEDNLRSVREGFRGKATQLLAEGKPEESAIATQKADAVVTLIGAPGSHFPDEDAYQDYMNEPATKQAIRQHIQQWEEVIDPQFKLAMRIDPDVELPSRGLQTGMRLNLKVVFPDEQGVNVVGRAAGPSLTATFRRKSPFGRQAKGTGQAYEVNYHELIANTFQRQDPIAKKNDMDQKLVASGNAKIAPPGQAIEVAGERGVAFPLARQTVILPGRQPFSQARNIYVRQSLAREYRTASNVDASFTIPVITPIMTAFNRAALAGLTDFTVHMSNQATALFNRPVAGGLITDILLSATGRADVPVVLIKGLIKTFQNNDRQLAELAEIGALREPHPGRNPLGRILARTDQITRLLLDDAFQRLVRDGLVPNTETARREYVNAIGQYNKRMVGPLTRFLRETGFGPFVVAGKTFNTLGVKMITLSPGTKATNVFAAAALRANILAKWVGFAVLLGVLNYLLTRNKKGGMLGRKGVPLGNLDTGLNNRKGAPLSIPLMDILGLGRGTRVTGLKGYVQSKYLGLTDGQALDAAARDIVNSAVGPIMGPGPRFLSITATGGQPAVSVPRTAPYAPPGENQFKVNIEAALKEANPLVRSVIDVTEGKTAAEAVGRQFPRFAMRPGMEAEKAEKMPQIVNAAQLRQYADALAQEARKLPLGERYRYVTRKLVQDQVAGENRGRALIQLERQGVFKYR